MTKAIMGEITRTKPHFGMKLDKMSNDATRAEACRIMAERARNAYFEGRAAMIMQVVNSNWRQWSRLSFAEREVVGDRLWNGSKKAKDLLGDEQLFSRWADVFSTLAMRSYLHQIRVLMTTRPR